MILGLLTISPTGTLAIADLTGSIALDLTHAKPIPEDGAWFAPGMIVLVDGSYEEEDGTVVGGLGNAGGIGGTIGGKFIGFFIGGPPCERRKVTLGLTSGESEGGLTAGGGFGWVDFLGVGSERAVGPKMRKIEARILRPSPTQAADPEFSGGRGRMVMLGELNLDQPQVLQALRKVLSLYASEPEDYTPCTFVLFGNFNTHAIMARSAGGGSIEYKESFDSLAATLSDFPTLLQSSTFVFVPGDNDGWTSSFSAGAATVLPRKGVPEMFTSRIKKAFVSANAEIGKKEGGGEAIWTSNPARIALFGPTHEVLLVRDNMTSRLRRTAIKFSSKPDQDEEETSDAEMAATPPPRVRETSLPIPPANETDTETSNTAAADHAQHLARKLTKTLLDQGYLAPFPLTTRPVLWDYASALQIYPLPTALVLADQDADAFCVTYEGCCVMNPGRLVAGGRRGAARWVEYGVRGRVGRVREVGF